MWRSWNPLMKHDYKFWLRSQAPCLPPAGIMVETGSGEAFQVLLPWLSLCNFMVIGQQFALQKLELRESPLSPLLGCSIALSQRFSDHVRHSAGTGIWALVLSGVKPVLYRLSYPGIHPYRSFNLFGKKGFSFSPIICWALLNCISEMVSRNWLSGYIAQRMPGLSGPGFKVQSSQSRCLASP